VKLETNSRYRTRTALLIEGEPAITELMTRLLTQQGFHCKLASTLSEGKQLIHSDSSWNLAFIALDLPDGNGQELIGHCSMANPAASIYALIDPADVVGAFQTLKAGAKDCMIKYPDADRLSRQAGLAISCHVRSAQSTEKPSASDLTELALRSISWKSAAMQRALAAANQASKDCGAVVIEGEPNTGKDAFTKLILREVNATSGQISLFDASKVSAEEIEVLLFGSPIRKRAKSSATGFLTEGSSVWKILRGAECLSPVAQQAVAASVSQNSIGTSSTPHGRFIICISSNSAKRGNVAHPFAKMPCHQILIPPLRDCVADFEPIMDRILERICLTRRIGFIGMTPSATQVLKAHSWPGNLAELRCVLEHAATHSQDGVIGIDDLPPLDQQLHAFKPRIALGIATIQNIQKAALVSALESCNGNRRLAARKMGVSLRSIYNMINRYDLAEESGGS
jgi:two-component system, NtrC family, response regulator